MDQVPTSPNAMDGDARLPDSLNSIAVKDFVDADDGDAEFERLRGEEAIEGVSVVKWKQAGADGVRWIDLDGSEVLSAEHIGEVGHKDMWRHLAGVYFDCEFPRDNRGDQDFVIGTGDEAVADFS